MPLRHSRTQRSTQPPPESMQRTPTATPEEPAAPESVILRTLGSTDLGPSAMDPSHQGDRVGQPEAKLRQRKRRCTDDLSINMREGQYMPAKRRRAAQAAQQPTPPPTTNMQSALSSNPEDRSPPKEVAMAQPDSNNFCACIPAEPPTPQPTASMHQALPSYSENQSPYKDVAMANADSNNYSALTPAPSHQGDQDIYEASKSRPRKRRRYDDLTIDMREQHYAPAGRGRRQKTSPPTDSSGSPQHAPLTPASLKSPEPEAKASETVLIGITEEQPTAGNKPEDPKSRVPPKATVRPALHHLPARQHKVEGTAHTTSAREIEVMHKIQAAQEPGNPDVQDTQGVYEKQGQDSNKQDTVTKSKTKSTSKSPQHKKPATPPLPARSGPKIKTTPKDPGFMPSEANGLRFEHGNPKTARSAHELNSLFKPPVMEKEPQNWITKSYTRFGDMPRPAEAARLLDVMERGQNQYNKRLLWEMRLDESEEEEEAETGSDVPGGAGRNKRNKRRRRS